MEKKYNMRSAGVKRLMREAIELKDPTTMYSAQPLEDNLFEWHFTILGPAGTDFEGGIYHGRILLPTDYPMKPPSIIMLTPNGRFELGQKICLSASSYHPELWQPSWSIRTVLLAMIGFMPTEGVGAIGSLDCLPEERKRLARLSNDWVCPVCGVANRTILPKEEAGSGKSQEKAMAEAADIVTQMAFKSEAEVKAQKAQLSKEKERQPTTAPSLTNSVSTSKKETPSNSNSETSALRQRTVTNNETQQQPSTAFVSMVPPDVRQATVRLQPMDTVFPHRSRGWGSLILIWMLLLTITLLVARRLYNMAMSNE